MEKNISDLVGLWRGELLVDGQSCTVDFNVRHPETSFFTVYLMGGKILDEWQAKPSLEKQEDVWKIMLNNPSIPLEDNPYSNLILWSCSDDCIIILLEDGEKVTLNKLDKKKQHG